MRNKKRRTIQAGNSVAGGFYFLDAPGGTRKTFLISLLLATIHSHNIIALALASSGIAATLLDGGRTAHSGSELPLNYQVNESPTYNISKTPGTEKLLKRCRIIIWNECTMANKKSVEALVNHRICIFTPKMEKPKMCTTEHYNKKCLLLR